MAPENTRRWQRHPVTLPVRIITANEVSEIKVPGLTTEISRGGMALYGGVPLQPGDLMQVEFETSDPVRVAASIRDRNGYCFGLEFLGLLPNESTQDARARFAEIVQPAEMESPARTAAIPFRAMGGENDILALFLERHETYLRQRAMEIEKLRAEIQEIRQSRRKIELMMLRQMLARSR